MYNICANDIDEAEAQCQAVKEEEEEEEEEELVIPLPKSWSEPKTKKQVVNISKNTP